MTAVVTRDEAMSELSETLRARREKRDKRKSVAEAAADQVRIERLQHAYDLLVKCYHDHGGSRP